MLFSHTNRHGSFHSVAMLAASAIWPWFDAPSPYIDTHTPPSFLYLCANATPAPTGTCAPTMPLPP
jgi:hypothetical protein